MNPNVCPTCHVRGGHYPWCFQKRLEEGTRHEDIVKRLDEIIKLLKETK